MGKKQGGDTPRLATVADSGITIPPMTATPPVTPPTGVAPTLDWAHHFHAFTPQHGVTLLVFVGSMVAAAALGRRWRGQGREWLLRAGWIWTTIAWQTLAVIYYLLPANFDPYESWPLHLCDLAAWVAPFALLTQKRWLRTLLYFWGIGLSTQAFITPVVQGGYLDIKYWLFFVGHTQIVGSAVYDVVALGYRPRLRDWGVATLITLGWMAVVTPINVIFDVNYGYTGRHLPDGPTLLDNLGPWPWRILWLFFAGQAAWFLAWVVWPIAGGIVRRLHPTEATTPPPID